MPLFDYADVIWEDKNNTLMKHTVTNTAKSQGKNCLVKPKFSS